MKRSEWDKQYEEWRNAMIEDNSRTDMFESAFWIHIVQSTNEWIDNWYDDEDDDGNTIDDLIDLDLIDVAGAIQARMTRDDVGFQTATEHFLEDNNIDILDSEGKWRNPDGWLVDEQ